MSDKKFSKEYLEEVFDELFYGKHYFTEDQKIYKNQLDSLAIDLKGQVLEGYHYKIDSGPVSEETRKEGIRNVQAHTGYGGTRLYIDCCRKQGLPDSLTAQSIFVYLDDEKWYPLSVLRKTKVENGK